VNPGNSGGPLVDIRGRLIGMNVAIATAQAAEGSQSEGQSAGISFAIPLATVETRVSQIIDGGKATPAFLGVSFGRRDQVKFIDEEGFRGKGFFVESAVPGGAAEKAGIKGGDYIIAIDGEAPAESAVLRSMINAHKPGDIVVVRVWREGTAIDFTVTMGEAPKQVRNDATLRLLYQRTGLAVTEGRSGLVVDLVEGEMAASIAGFKRNQHVVKVGDTEVADVDSFAAALSDQGFLTGDAIYISVTDADAAADAEPKKLRLQLSR